MSSINKYNSHKISVEFSIIFKSLRWFWNKNVWGQQCSNINQSLSWMLVEECNFTPSPFLQYRIYSIKDGKDGKSLPIKLCDTMGLDEKEGVGLCMDDIPHILKGCVPDRYHVRTI